MTLQMALSKGEFFTACKLIALGQAGFLGFDAAVDVTTACGLPTIGGLTPSDSQPAATDDSNPFDAAPPPRKAATLSLGSGTLAESGI